MKPYYQDNDTVLHNSDARHMDALEDGSVQMVCTSPPYWGLRKYAGVPDLIWKGAPGCDHEWGKESFKTSTPDTASGIQGTPRPGNDYTASLGTTCSLCGAWRGSYGLEPTPELYVDHTIEVLREVRRVLRDDGVVFWNIGDSYASGKPKDYNSKGYDDPGWSNNQSRVAPPGLKPKDLVLIPFRVALAAQADGWWVRSIIIWDKANPMPESVRDRPTTSHEYIIMLTKSARYYWDAEAVRETAIHEGRLVKASGPTAKNAIADEVNDRATAAGFTKHDTLVTGRNVRSVWSFPSQPHPEAHFATFPEALPERCIKAATPEVGCCEKCGAPWTRVLKGGFTDHDGETESEYGTGTTANRLAKMRQAARAQGGEYANTRETTGWQPTCKCDAGKVPSVVLDPFAGNGTTLWVAKRLGRKSVGYELSEEYCALAVERLHQQVLL